MIPEYSLKAEDVHHQTIKTLMAHLSVKVAGYVCHTVMVWDILLKASVEQVSIEATCADLDEVADSNTVREHLNAALPIANLRQQEAEMNKALAASIPIDMRRGGVEVAIDFHDEPFYGKASEVKVLTCRGPAKKGTTHFIRIASAYSILSFISIGHLTRSTITTAVVLALSVVIASCAEFAFPPLLSTLLCAFFS